MGFCKHSRNTELTQWALYINYYGTDCMKIKPETCYVLMDSLCPSFLKLTVRDSNCTLFGRRNKKMHSLPVPFRWEIGCPSKLVSIRNNRNWNRNLFRHYPKQNVCFSCFASIPKQRVSMFRLNRNKQKTNRNSLIGSIVCNFLQKIYGFFGFFGFLRFFFGFFGFFGFFLGFFGLSKKFVSVFRLFRFYTETESFDWSETNRRPTQTV